LPGFENSPLFDARVKAALAYAEAVTCTDRQVGTELIAFQNLSSKFNAALDVAAQGFCRASSALGINHKK
jgi:hypothetical protein